jgi:hypothetical protein
MRLRRATADKPVRVATSKNYPGLHSHVNRAVPGRGLKPLRGADRYRLRADRGERGSDRGGRRGV